MLVAEEAGVADTRRSKGYEREIGNDWEELLSSETSSRRAIKGPGHQNKTECARIEI